MNTGSCVGTFTCDIMCDVPTNVAYDLEANGTPCMNINWSAIVKQIRSARGFTQEDFARELDVTTGTMNGWENGKHRPVKAQRKRLLKMAQEWGIDIPAPFPPMDNQGTS